MALRWLFALLLVLIPALGHAQDGMYCSAGAGAAASIAPAGRGWDLSTPGPWATGLTPALNSQCDFGFMFVGIEGLPLMRHSYTSLGGRGPVLLTATIGSSIRVADGIRAGHYLTSNGAARGLGLRTTIDLGELGPTHPMIELRAGVLRGLNPTWNAMAVLHLYRFDLEDAEYGRHLGPGDLRYGFTVGTLTGVRAEWAVDRHRYLDAVMFGVRAGVLHNRRAGAPLQPVALPYMVLPLGGEGGGLEVTAGPTLRKGVVRPLFGASLRAYGDEAPIQIHAGLLVGTGDGIYITPDIGVSLVW